MTPPLRAVVGVLLLASITPGWCPEAPLLAEAEESVLRSYLTMSPAEMSALLARHQVRRLPADFATIARVVAEESRRNGLPPELVLAVITAESTFRGDAISARGAMGLMQLMPGTAAWLAPQLGMTWTGESLLFDPQANITLGAYYLARLLGTFEDLDRALAAYNRGPGFQSLDGGLPRSGETAAFLERVKKVMAHRDLLAPGRTFGEPHPFRTSIDLSL